MAIALDLLNIQDRKQLIKDILHETNIERKTRSKRQADIYNGKISQPVYDMLSKRFGPDTMRELPVISSINLCKRVVDEEGGIYKREPERSYTNTSEDQKEKLDRIYKDMGANSKLLKSNQSFKLQDQNHVMVIPKNGKLIMRSLRNHQIDKIDDSSDPEKAGGYVLSSFDVGTMIENVGSDIGGAGGGDQMQNRVDRDPARENSSIGDSADWQISNGRFTVWTDEYNFTMNVEGDFIDSMGRVLNEVTIDDITNPLGMIPIVDISQEKDFVYWVDMINGVADFTVEYNAYLTDLLQINSMQGFAQAYLIGDDSIIPQNIQIGPQYIIKLPVDSAVDAVRPEFGYATPNPDMQGSLALGEMLISNFLSSRGKDPSLVSGKGQGKKYSSGTERLLAMIELFDASRSDYSLFKTAEEEIYFIVKAWHNLAIGTDLLDKKYISTQLADDSELAVTFAGPEMIQSEQEKLDNWDRKIEMGIASRVDAYMDEKGLDDRDEALEKLRELEKEELELMGGTDANIKRESDQENNFEPRGDEPSSEDTSEE